MKEYEDEEGNTHYIVSAVLTPQEAETAAKTEPENNQGRTACFWCNKPTSKIGLHNDMDVCPDCQK